MKYLLSIGFMLLFSCEAYAQRDVTDTIKTVTLDEVRIESGYDLNTQNNKTKRKSGQARTERILESIPGISIISRGAFAQEPVIRGMSDGQIQININGMKIFGACTDRMDPSTSYIEPNNLEKIKLSHGPGFDAGGATIGGSLNFSLKEPVLNADREIQGSAGAGFETNAIARQFLGNLQFSKKKFALNVNAIYRKAENYTPGGNKGDLLESFGNWTSTTGFSVDDRARIRFSQYQKWNAGMGMKLMLNDRNFLTAHYIADRGKDIGYPALTMDVASANANIASINHQYINGSRKLNNIESALYFNNVHHVMDDTKRPAEQISMHMDMPGRSWTAGHFTKAALQLPHQDIQLRFENFVNRWHAEMTMHGSSGTMFMLTIPDAQRFVSGIDISDRIHINNLLSLIAGARAEYNSSTIFTEAGKNQLTGIYEQDPDKGDFLWNAYLQGNFDVSDKLRISLKGARALRSATLKELYSVYLLNRVDGYEYLGNPALRNESAVNIDAIIIYRAEKWYASAKGFSYFFKNYIAGSVLPHVNATMGASGVKQYINLANARTSGAELIFNLSPFPHLSFNSINTYQSGNDKNGNALPMMNPFHSINKIEWTPDNTWNLFAESVYAAAQKKISSFYGESPTPAFNVINAGVVKTFQLKEQRIIASLAGLNLFNQYYYEHLDVIKLPRPGRNIVVHLTLNF